MLRISVQDSAAVLPNRRLMEMMSITMFDHHLGDKVPSCNRFQRLMNEQGLVARGF